MARRGTTATTPQRTETGTRKKVAKARRPKGKPVDAADSAFVDALSVDFRCHGAAAISRLREDDPVAYIKMCASVLPKAIIDGLDPLAAMTANETDDKIVNYILKAINFLGFNFGTAKNDPNVGVTRTDGPQ